MEEYSDPHSFLNIAERKLLHVLNKSYVAGNLVRLFAMFRTGFIWARSYSKSIRSYLLYEWNGKSPGRTG